MGAILFHRSMTMMVYAGAQLHSLNSSNILSGMVTGTRFCAGRWSKAKALPEGDGGFSASVSQELLLNKLHGLRAFNMGTNSRKLQAAMPTEIQTGKETDTTLYTPDDDTVSFTSEEERAMMSADQLAFLVRKRKAAAGLGPVMPEASACEECGGQGMRACHQCDGTGVNAEGTADSLFDEGVHVRNGVMDPKWMFHDDGPCWLCKGMAMVACKECSGTGIRGGIDGYTGD